MLLLSWLLDSNITMTYSITTTNLFYKIYYSLKKNNNNNLIMFFTSYLKFNYFNYSDNSEVIIIFIPILQKGF